jgi:hypothetical protein
VRIGVLAALPGAAGSVDGYELAAVPVAVLLLGATGVLLARLIRSVIVAPLVLLTLAVATYVAALVSHGRFAGVLPASITADPMPLPVDLMDRPAAAHLAYLTGLVVLVAGIALARAGARGPRLLALAAAGLSITVVAGGWQFLPSGDAVRPARITATDRPAERQTCRTVDQVTYCAFDGFLPWVDGWDTVVRGVLRRFPAEDARQPLVIRQRVWAHDYPVDGYTQSAEQAQARTDAWRAADRAAGTPNTVPVGTTWGDGRSVVGLAGLVAYETIARTGAGVDGPVCGSRAVLVAWLAGQASPAAAAGLREADETSWGGVPLAEQSFGTGVTVPDREMAVAHALLSEPADQVGAELLRSWAELSAADTPTERIGEIFGVPVAPLPPENERMVCTA